MKNLELFPLITEKSTQASGGGVYVFKTEKQYTKDEIKNFLEKRFSVRIIGLRTSIFVKTKKSRAAGDRSRAYFKKVYVKVANGVKIPLFEGV